eukprot:s1587_g1.t1
MQYAPIDLASWKQAINAKKNRTATGLDGISKGDLQALPDALHLEIIRLLHRAEETGEWPCQALQGAIHSLAKCPDADSVDKFRPVTILPLVYRCWSSIRSKEILRHIEAIAPPSMMGNLPGRSSPAVWWQLQSLVERSLYDGSPCTGIVSDLIKAFNGLPRYPLFEIAVHIGICPGIVRAWASAVSQVTRQFWVRGQPGPPLRSSTGYPEGCGLSVCAMCLCNLLLHSYMHHRCPRAALFTYVDNVELLADDPQDAVEALEVLANLTDFLGTPIDRRKTYGWSLDASGRRVLRDAQQTVCRSHADLGAHLQYSGNQTNGSVKKKCHELAQLWPRLAQSNAPLSHKLRVLVSVAWPRAFHAASTVHLAEQVVQELRAGAMQSLRLDKTGASSLLQLSMSTNTLIDPGFFLLWDSLTQFRRFACFETEASTLDLAAWLPDRLKKPGPCGVLAARLTEVGWLHLREFLYVDQEGIQIDIMRCPIQELKCRVKRAWHHHVGSTLSYRKGFQGLAHVDVATSTKPVQAMTADEVGLIRALQNGTFITHDHLCSAKQVDDDHCKFCGQPDSLTHRHWECECTAHLRKNLSSTLIEAVSDWPECTKERGWFVEPSCVRTFKQQLGDVPLFSYFWGGQFPPGVLDFFTDGSRLAPQIPNARLVSWSVVVSVGDIIAPRFEHVAGGGVPGQWQTILRAELTAAIMAVRQGLILQQPIRLWCDNATVVRRMTKMLHGRFTNRNTLPDHDLWAILHDLVLKCRQSVQVFKVASHQADPGPDDFLRWVFAGNQCADHSALISMSFLPQAVLHSQSLVEAQLSHNLQLQQELHAYYAKVGLFAVQWNSDEKNQTEVHVSREPITAENEISLGLVGRRAHAAPQPMQFSGFHKVIEWLQYVQSPDDSIAPSWITWYELLWSFQRYTGIRSLRKVDAHSKWTIESERNEYDCVKTCSPWFKPWLVVVCKMPCLHRGYLWLLQLVVAIRPQTDSPLKPGAGLSSATSSGGALFFSAVERTFRDTVKQNALHLQASGLVDVFLAHPRQDVEDWQRESWYKQAVKYSVSYKETKWGFVLNELVKQQTFRLNGYSWYWISDEDVDLTHLNLRRYLALATESGASIVQPAVAFDTRGIPQNDLVMAYTDHVKLPDGSYSHSLYRYSELVEAQSPMFTAESLRIAWNLYLPGLGSGHGMDLVWCRFVAAKLNRSVEQGCAIIDAEHMYKLPNIRNYNLQNSMAVEEVIVSQHQDYLQRTLDKSGKLREGLQQLCRTDHASAQLVHLRIRPQHYEAILLLRAFVRCKRYSLQAVCHIHLSVILATLLWLLLEALLLISIPVLLWYTFKYLWSRARNVKDVPFSRRIRIPYRHQVLSDAN